MSDYVPNFHKLSVCSQQLILLFAAPRDPFDMVARQLFAKTLVLVFLSGCQWKSRLIMSEADGSEVRVPLVESVAYIWCKKMFHRSKLQFTTTKEPDLVWTRALATVHPGWRPFSNEDLRRAVKAWYNGEDRDLTGPIGQWDTSGITDMSGLFENQGNFNDDIRNWNVSKVTNMRCMFYNTHAFNQPLDSWNVSNVTNMDWMFSNTDSFNQPLNSWNVSNVTNMLFMFSGADALTEKPSWYK